MMDEAGRGGGDVAFNGNRFLDLDLTLEVGVSMRSIHPRQLDHYE